jgi:hypothetical protein
MMTSLVLAVAILFQGTAALKSGSVSGQIRLTTGQAPDLLRIAAIPASDSPAPEGIVLVGLGQTDSTGRFRLDAIPPGRYYIMAGFVEAPTYYPGVRRLADARIVTVTNEALVDGINFVVEPSALLFGGRPVVEVRGEVVVENGGALPASLGVHSRTTDNSRDGLAGTAVGPAGKFRLGLKPGDHRVTVTRLPLNTVVQSISYGTQDLMQSTLKVSDATTDIITIKLRTAPAESSFKVSGQVKNLPKLIFGRRPGLRLRPSVDRPNGGGPVVLAQIADAPIRDDDAFEFLGVPPGRYLLTFTGFEEAGLTGTEVLVSDGDVRVDLELGKRTEIIADIKVVDERGGFLPDIAPPSWIGLYFSSPSFGMTGSGLAQRLEPGEYTASVRSVPAPFSLKSLSSGSTDLLKAPLRVELSPTALRIEIVLEYKGR